LEEILKFTSRDISVGYKVRAYVYTRDYFGGKQGKLGIVTMLTLSNAKIEYEDGEIRYVHPFDLKRVDNV